MNWNELRDQAYLNSVKHGFHKGDESVQHYLCLVVTELSEAVEADRHKRVADMVVFGETLASKVGLQYANHSVMFDSLFEDQVKDTVQDELADTVIRLLDLSGMVALDLDAEIHQLIRVCLGEEGRIKKSFTERVWKIIARMASCASPKHAIPRAIADVIVLCMDYGYDLFWHIELKMQYNQNRPIRHGKEY